jgi:NAD-dependent SIR2 family protein deacetylase
MRTLFVIALFAAGLLAVPAASEEKKEKALTGTFTRKADALDLKLVFKKDNVFDFHATIGEASCVMTSKYTKETDGTYKCEVTNFEKKGDFPAERAKGYKFSFKLEVKEKKVVMSDLTGDEIGDDQRKAIEGEYEQAAGD